MILIDTDHLSVLVDRRHSLRSKLQARLDRAGDSIATSIVSVEEQLRGWLVQLHRVRDPHQQMIPYIRLLKLIDFLQDWQILEWNEPAADAFVRLRRERIRIGTQDLKIGLLTRICGWNMGRILMSH